VFIIKIKLIIFDLDDTLVNSKLDYSGIRKKIAKLYSEPPSPSEVQKTPILRLLEKLTFIHPDRADQGKKILSEEEKKAAIEAEVITGAEEVPKLLKKYDILAVIYTNNSQESVSHYLNQDRFAFLKDIPIYTREQFENVKPHPEGILKILELYQQQNITPDNSVYIGDSYLDALAAHNAKIKFIWFKSRDQYENPIPTIPYATLTHWKDFEDFLQNHI